MLTSTEKLKIREFSEIEVHKCCQNVKIIFKFFQNINKMHLKLAF